MPLPLKTLQEAASELGIPEGELKVLVDLHKVRAVLKKGKLQFAPDEIAKIKRLKKTLPESAKASTASAIPPASTPPKTAPPKPAPPPRMSPPPKPKIYDLN